MECLPMLNLFTCRFDSIDLKLPVEYITKVDDNVTIYADMLDFHPKKTIPQLLLSKEVNPCWYNVFQIFFLLICKKKLIDLNFRRVHVLSMLAL